MGVGFVGAGGFFVQARNAEPPGQFGLDFGQRDVAMRQHDKQVIDQIGRLADQMLPPRSSGSPAASTTSAASSTNLSPILGTPPANSVVVYDFSGGLRLAILDDRHQAGKYVSQRESLTTWTTFQCKRIGLRYYSGNYRQ